MNQKLKLSALAALLTLVLSACTVTFIPSDVSVSTNLRFGIELSSVIQEFRVDKGSGSSYNIGESISFVIRTDRAGYVTLTEIDPFGRVDTFGRNIFVNAGTSIITGPDDRGTFAIGATSVQGQHRVRASFTPSPTNVTRVVYQGVVGEDGWTSSIVTDIRPFTVRDIAETHFFIR